MKREGVGEVEYRLDRVKERAIPVFFEKAPYPLNGIVLTMVRRIIGELHGHVKVVSEVGHAVHKLCASAVIFGSIVLINHERLDGREALLLRKPEIR